MAFPPDRIKVGISSCLLGNEVRYNGSHKLSTLCTEDLGRFFEFVPTCPEAGAGMGVPRPPIRLTGDAAAPRAVRVEDTGVDFTGDLQRYAAGRIPELQDLCGYIFIRNSPSCGLFRVKVYDDTGNVTSRDGRGIFAEALVRAMPLLPVEEEGRLQDPLLRENFVTRVQAFYDWRQSEAKGLSAAALVDFHSRYKYTLMAHSPQAYRELGRLIAEAGRHDPQELGRRYFAALMQALQQKATRRTNTNVLMHLQGYLKKHLGKEEKADLGEVIEQYRCGIVPISMPLTLLRHHFRRHPDPYIERQAFLRPWPDEPS